MNAPRFTIRARRSRAGFTLIEMMVAMAIAMGIFLILAEAFRISLDFIRTANSTGVMILQLNGAGNALQRDLAADHFQYEDGLPNGGVKLSDRRFNLIGATAPKGGYFQIINSAPPPTGQFFDGDGIAVNVATSHVLQFTSILPGGTDQNSFTALSPATTGAPYSARAAEIAYFLVQTGQTSVGGQPLFNLVRRYRLVALNSDDQPLLNLAVAGDTTYTDVISSTNGSTANTLSTITNPANRMPLPTPPSFQPGGSRFGEDILASNVLSFEVLAQWDGATSGNSSRPFSAGNTDGPYDFFQAAQPSGTFDTASPLPIRVRSLQITLRVYDPRMKHARQNTWKFAL